MKSACVSFRRALATALGEPESRQALGWHRHLMGCTECRALLESEEALDELLISLPSPRLPKDLTERVLACLLPDRLEELLELEARDAGEHVPTDLAQRVLRGVGRERADAQLDDLLDLVPEPNIPSDLGSRVLARLDADRKPAVRLLRFPVYIAAAAAALLAGWAWFASSRRPESFVAPGPTNATVAVVTEAPVDPDLLAALDVLENWEALTSDDLDLLFDEMNALDLALLEHDAGDDQEEDS